MKAAPFLSSNRTILGTVAIAASLALAACSSNGASSVQATVSPSATATATPPSGGGGATATPSGTPAQSAEATGVQTALDPCQLVTNTEASQLTGATYGAGAESTTDDGLGKICTYGAQTTNVFMVIVAQAPDVATAKAQEAAAEANLNANYPGVKVTITTLTDFQPNADAAAAQGSGSVSGVTFGAIGIYLLKGATFVSFSDVEVNATAPTLDAMKAQAGTTLSRVP
jgi:hypothetical protein